MYYKDVTPEEWEEALALNKWRRKEGAVTGVRVFVLAVANFPDPNGVDYKAAIEYYGLLLNNTFGENNVVYTGTGFQRKKKAQYFGSFYEDHTVYTKGEDFTGRKHLTQEELESIIAFENTLGMLGESKYDQIHFIGHGDAESPDPDKVGMLFLKGFKDPEEKTQPLKDAEGKIWRTGFDEGKADIMKDRSKWPINAGGKILLLGCDTAFGVFPGFLAGILPDCQIYSMAGRFQPWCLEAPDKKIYAMDWYFKYQHQSVRDIANWLQIDEPPAELPKEYYE